MTGAELLAARVAFGLTSSEMADALFLDRRSYERMERGGKFIPELLARVVRLELLERGLFAKLQEISLEEEETA